MNELNSETSPLEGGCLCGGLRYRISGPRRNIINCHCRNCRRAHGHYAAYTAVDKQDLTLVNAQSLKWYHDRSPNTYRGFCGDCGASLFWDARRGDNKLSIAAGSLDAGLGLKTIGHIYVGEAGDYYDIDDALPRYTGTSGGELDLE